MSEEQAPEKRKRRPRVEKQPPMQFPVEATLWYPGQKEPRRVEALWARREAEATVFGLPEFQRPYMQRTLRVPDACGVVVETVEMVFQQPAAAPPQLQSWGPPLPPPGPQSVGGPGAVLRQEQFGAAQTPRPRSVIGPSGPASEVVDESGMRTVVPAAFGLVVGSGA